MSFTTNRQSGNKIMQVAKQFAGRPAKVLIFFDWPSFHSNNIPYVYGMIKHLELQPTARIYVEHGDKTERFEATHIHSILSEFSKPKLPPGMLSSKTILFIITKDNTVVFCQLQQARMYKSGARIVIENWYPEQIENPITNDIPIASIKEVYILTP